MKFKFLLALSVLCLISCQNTKEIELVKSGYFTNNKSKTVGQAVDGFFSDPKWESGIGVDGKTKGKTLVNMSGGMTYMEKSVNAKIQFMVDVEKSSFQLSAFELNGIPQNQLLILTLINKMFEGQEAS